jgi:hypothetical protein
MAVFCLTLLGRWQSNESAVLLHATSSCGGRGPRVLAPAEGAMCCIVGVCVGTTSLMGDTPDTPKWNLAGCMSLLLHTYQAAGVAVVGCPLRAGMLRAVTDMERPWQQGLPSGLYLGLLLLANWSAGMGLRPIGIKSWLHSECMWQFLGQL